MTQRKIQKQTNKLTLLVKLNDLEVGAVLGEHGKQEATVRTIPCLRTTLTFILSVFFLLIIFFFSTPFLLTQNASVDVDSKKDYKKDKGVRFMKLKENP